MIMTLEQRITALAQAIGADIKDLYAQLMNPNFRQYHHQLFTTSGTWTVPAGVNLIWVDMVGGGGGGGGGHASATTGGGGGGGPSGVWFRWYPCVVVPGETLSVTIGAGGAGGSVGVSGGSGGDTVLSGGTDRLATHTSGFGFAGSATNGGASASAGHGNTGPTGGGIAGTVVSMSSIAPYAPRYAGDVFNIQQRGGSGGGPGYAGGESSFGMTMTASSVYKAGGTASGSAGTGMGGGGAGSCSLWGIGGNAGNAGSAGGSASGYGAGGGGGGCNAAGGAGTPGLLRIYWLS